MFSGLTFLLLVFLWFANNNMNIVKTKSTLTGLCNKLDCIDMDWSRGYQSNVKWSYFYPLGGSEGLNFVDTTASGKESNKTKQAIQIINFCHFLPPINHGALLRCCRV